MHYSRNLLTASMAYVTYTLAYLSTYDQRAWARPACPLVISLKTKPCQFNSVSFSSVMPLNWPSPWLIDLNLKV